jgi:glucose-6-phosphate 1-dehydrogenase
MATVAASRAERRIRGAEKPDDHVLVIFGATGDLSRRKLLPGLFHLAETGLLPDGYRIVGASHQDLSDDEFRDFARGASEQFGVLKPSDRSCDWQAFAQRSSYVGGGFGPGSSDAVTEAVARAESELSGARRLFFFAVPPGAFGPIVQGLAEAGLNENARVIMEKPFGTDLKSAKELNALVHALFAEEQVFRIDHFLGKEAIQNILALRFANGMFEPVWNRDHIDHVQIDVPETLTVAQRVGFYDATGAFRDMVVTHLFQLLAFLAMEPPASLQSKAIVDEKVKLFQAMRPLDPDEVVRGQYEGYREHEGVAPTSDTETLVALRACVDNWRWAGVPFYFRTGKRMALGKRIVTIRFKQPPKQMFELVDDRIDAAEHNALTFDLGERGGITARFLAKRPGPTIKLEPATMRFGYEQLSTGVLEAYERLFYDAMIGDRTLFTRADGIERLWEISAPLLDNPPKTRLYPQGSWGPEPGLHDLIAPRRWHLPTIAGLAEFSPASLSGR